MQVEETTPVVNPRAAIKKGGFQLKRVYAQSTPQVGVFTSVGFAMGVMLWALLNDPAKPGLWVHGVAGVLFGLVSVALHEFFAARRLRLLLTFFARHLSDAMVILDGQGRIVNVPDLAVEFGYDPKSVRGQEWHSLLEPTLRVRAQQFLQALKEHPHQVAGPYVQEARVASGRETVFSVSGFAVPRFFSTWFVIHVRDITEQHRLRQSMDRIEHLASVAHLTAGMAHNFNNVFASIILNAELLQTAQGAEQRRLTRHLVEAAERGGDLCRKLMTFAKSEPPSISAIPVDPLFADLQTLVGPDVHRRGITVSTQVEEGLCLSGDPNQVRQVVVNLLLNAIEAVGDGGCIELKAARQGEWVKLTVSNSGPNIPPEQIPVIFLPFFSTKDVTMQGVGMGLAVSHRLATGMGGTLEVSSPPGGLTSFTLSLPGVGF